MSDFARPEVLYIAALFHDIAKGRGGDHSQLGAVDARRFCAAHGLSREDTELIAWLVQDHLVMSATAQKQDIGDPQVIRAFAARVGEERHLTALYRLTVADIRGTSPRVWNAWKAKLLEDLYWATRNSLAGTPFFRGDELAGAPGRARAKLRLYAVPENAQEKLWQQLDEPIAAPRAAGDRLHTRTLYYRSDTTDPVVRRAPPAGEGLK